MPLANSQAPKQTPSQKNKPQKTLDPSTLREMAKKALEQDFPPSPEDFKLR